MSETYTDSHLREILTRTRRIAVVGVSMNPVRPSYYVARYLSLKRFEVVPVNPGHAGRMLFGQTVVASLSEIAGAVDMVDIFRRSEHVPPIVEEALEVSRFAHDLDADRGGTRGCGGDGPRARRRGGDEPLPQDRVSAAFRRVADGRVQHRRYLVAAVSRC